MYIEKIRAGVYHLCQIPAETTDISDIIPIHSAKHLQYTVKLLVEECSFKVIRRTFHTGKNKTELITSENYSIDTAMIDYNREQNYYYKFG